MKYITHHRFKGLSICGKQLNLPYGTELDTIGDFLITKEQQPVCYKTSENAKIHFAVNDDGHGLERGALTYAIAYSNRHAKNGFRFSDNEQEILERDWSHFLRHDVDTFLFNEDFFAADPMKLQELADILQIKVRR